MINLQRWRERWAKQMTLDENEFGARRTIVFIHTKTQHCMYTTANRFALEKASLIHQGMAYRCRFQSVWRSSSGQAYRVVHHQFGLFGPNKKWDSSREAWIMGCGFTGKILTGHFVYNELFPINDAVLLAALEKRAAEECESCDATGCLDRCSECPVTFCSPEHKALHDVCGTSKPKVGALEHATASFSIFRGGEPSTVC